MAKVGSIVLFSLFSLMWADAARAQGNGKFPWDEYEKRIGQAREVAMLKEDLMGDEVNLSNGVLSFSATDVSIPGNNALAVGFSRRYSVQNQYGRMTDLMLGDWDLDVPHITGTFAPDWLTTSTTAPTARCSASDLDTRPPTPVWDFPYSDFWNGNTISIPGGAGGELLRPVAGVDMPTTGGPYRWMTPGFAYVSCLPTIKNGSGEGFLAIAPDGTRYWFDWMAQYFEPNAASENTGGIYTINRRRNFLYATKVEDRWGNTVEYQYSNAWNAPGRLPGISASDGRTLSIAYNSNGQVASVSDGTRSWQYQYVSVGGRRSLSAVILPDASRWNIDFRAFTSAEILYVPGTKEEPARDCFMRFFAPVGPTQVVGSIQHPSGAHGSFQVQWMTHGRSNVPVACQGFNWGSTGTDTNDDVNQWPIFYEIYSLVSKTISGAAVQTGQWSYAYEPHISFDFYPGGTMERPCPMGVTCGEPICSSESCARSSRTTITGPDGQLLRYSHGNSFRYNEGKLLRIERGRVGEAPMSVQISTYDLSQTQQTYPARFGVSLRENSDGFTSEFHRPLQSTTTIQQGRSFNTANEQFDKFARPTRVTRSSGPAP